MSSSVSSEGILRTLDFGTESGIKTVNDLDKDITKSFLGTPLPAWGLFLSRKQEFFRRTPVPSPNYSEPAKVSEKDLSSAGEQVKETRG